VSSPGAPRALPARRRLAILVVAFLLILLPAARRAAPSRRAVLFIGDGMGPAYVTLTRVARGGSGGQLVLDTLPYTALSRTHSADSPVTDSAAAASAMACGMKTVIGVLCEDATAVRARQDGKKLESIASWAKKRGFRVGLVTTTTVTHATPAAFYAHHHDRNAEEQIARQAVASGFDLILGGGRRYFPDDLRREAHDRGWAIVETREALAAVDSLDRHVLGLFADGHLPYHEEIETARRRAREGGAQSGDDAVVAPTLPEMTRKAIDLLERGGQPFFLMVEGGRIDHAGHANWARTLVDETVAFDEAVGFAIRTLEPETTLVLVTADHETGGLAINGYPDEKEGPWSLFRGPFEEKGDEPYAVVTFTSGPGTKRQSRAAPHGSDDPRPSGISLGSAAHTGVDVALYGWGAGAERVRGTLENTAVYEVLRAHLEGAPSKR
jgi:alkaline phosphatase